MKKHRAGRIILFLLALLVAAGVYIVVKNQYLRQMPIGTGSKAKLVCSAVFLSGRDPAAVEAEDLGFHPLFKIFKTRVDRENAKVTCSLFGLGLFQATAVYREGIGAVLLNEGVTEADVAKWPKPVFDPAVEGIDPEAVDWPTGDRLAHYPAFTGIDIEAIRAAGDRLFVESDPNDLNRTRAVLVLHDGALLYERYGEGFTKNTRLISWSMAKSITHALVGILVGQGKLDIHQPAPVPEWSGEDDPRRSITLDQLMRMSSGLEWSESYTDRPVSDVNTMLFRKADMAAYAASRPPAAPPDSVWNYSSGTTNLVQRIIRRACGTDEAYWNFPRRALFDKMGMRSAVWERDASGTFIGSSLIYATARDFARFGLLCAHDGVWQGERILPEGWMRYATTPTARAPQGQYGSFFWLNAGDPKNPESRLIPGIPADAFFCWGYQGQSIAVLPSQRLVVVRLGMAYDDEWGEKDFLASLVAATK